MRILLVNYRYFVSGGPERYMFNVKNALESAGHEIVPFSIKYTKNVSSEYDKYFVSPLAGPDAIQFDEHKWTTGSFIKTLERSFYSYEVEKAVGKLVDDTMPDIAYVLHFLRKLSPAVLVGIKKRGIPIIVRISDFLWICPAIHCLRDGKPCTLCIGGNLWPSVRYRCVKNSLGASIVSFLTWHYHKLRGYFDLIDRFVITNEFMLEKMMGAGWPREKLVLIHTFAPQDCFSPNLGSKQKKTGYILFSGHLEKYKGPDLLIHAYAQAVKESPEQSPRLKIAGWSNNFAEICRDLANNLGIGNSVDFLGFVDGESLRELYRNALFTVIPSIFFENLPNVLIESYASGTAVIGSAHGSIGPYIEEGITGLTFPPGDADSLAEKLIQAWSDPEWCARAGLAARDKAREIFSADKHIEQLLSLFEEISGKL